MSKLLKLVDQLLGDILQENVYSNTSQYRATLNSQPQSLPVEPYKHIPNTDPRLLDLRSPTGFEHPHDDISKEPLRRVIPPQPMHDTVGIFTDSSVGRIKEDKRLGFYSDQGGKPPQSIAQQLNNLENQQQFLKREEIYGPRGVVPPNITSQRDSLQLDKPPPPGAYTPPGTQGPSNQTVRQLKRETIYAPPPPSPTPPLVENQARPQNQYSPRDEIYKSNYQRDPTLGDDSSLASLADFHESKTRPPIPSSVATRKIGSGDDAFIPKNPVDSDTTAAKFGTVTRQEFQNPSSLRPLNFQNAGDSPPRQSLVAENHLQKIGWNSENVQPVAQRLGMLEDNIYDDTDIPFEGNFQSVFRGPVPQPLNYTNIIATSHWLRNIGRELFVGNLDGGFSGGGPPSTDSLDVNKTVGGLAKGVSFIATQFLLAAFNPANPESGGPLNAIWNPLSITAAIPLIGGLASSVTAGAALFGSHKDRVSEAEAAGLARLTLAREGLYTEISPVHRLSKLQLPISMPGFQGDVVGTGDDTLDKQLSDVLPSKPLVTIEGQTGGGALAFNIARKQGVHTNLYSELNPYGSSGDGALFPMERLQKISKEGGDPVEKKLSTLFNARVRGKGGGTVFGALPPAVFGEFVAKDIRNTTDIGISPEHLFSSETTEGADAPGLNAGIVPASLPGEVTDEPPEGSNTTVRPDGTVSEPIPDGNIYMPFMFQDLRDPKGEQKFLYFRAFLKEGISETFIPDWESSRYYGRVDNVPIYKGTARQLSFSFDIAAFKPSDLKVIWFKIQKLQSMVYPTYDLRGLMEAGPIIRMRIGDLFAGQGNGVNGVGRGLPGYISGMDFSFPDGIWEIDKDFKVPRLVTVSMSFVVVHDGNPGIYKRRSYELDSDGTLIGGTTTDAVRVFGAGKFAQSSADSSITKVQVSTAEIRRIFSTIRNSN